MSAIDNVIQMKEQEQEVKIVHSYRVSGKRPTILIAIPKEIRKEIREQYNLENPSSLYLIPKKDGFLVRKVDLESVK